MISEEEDCGGCRYPKASCPKQEACKWGQETELKSQRPDWDPYFLKIASAVSDRAECTRRKVAAVLVKDHRIKATGYNGAPAGRPSCLDGACPRGTMSREEMPGYSAGNHDYSNCISIHAEQNAILESSPQDRDGATLYVTDEPCFACQKTIQATGILKVIWPTGSWFVLDVFESSSKN